ncbi:MAG TPA: isoprenylcysteine carboxylmethyltransferase family protein [Tepidisphaeraceae bacterium]|nr:isoprenylcysteine carboxylmethyltransferase family protein [Tepidisphaeraceae bacterium]
MTFTSSPSSWPSVIVGAILLVYWVKVLQLVVRTRRTVGRAANIVPPEPLGRALRIVWGPAVVLWIFLPLLVPFVLDPPAGLRPIWNVYGNGIVGWTMVAIALAALTITWVCWIKMGTSWRMGIDPNEKTRLVFTGPYSRVRHPIYGLSQVLGVVAVVVMPSPVMIAVGALHVFLMQWESRREEKFLVALHGPVYADYIRQTGRFIPRIKAARPHGADAAFPAEEGATKAA